MCRREAPPEVPHVSESNRRGEDTRCSSGGLTEPLRAFRRHVLPERPVPLRHPAAESSDPKWGWRAGSGSRSPQNGKPPSPTEDSARVLFGHSQPHELEFVLQRGLGGQLVVLRRQSSPRDRRGRGGEQSACFETFKTTVAAPCMVGCLAQTRSSRAALSLEVYVSARWCCSWASAVCSRLSSSS